VDGVKSTRHLEAHSGDVLGNKISHCEVEGYEAVCFQGRESVSLPFLVRLVFLPYQIVTKKRRRTRGVFGKKKVAGKKKKKGKDGLKQEVKKLFKMWFWGEPPGSKAAQRDRGFG